MDEDKDWWSEWSEAMDDVSDLATSALGKAKSALEVQLGEAASNNPELVVQLATRIMDGVSLRGMFKPFGRAVERSSLEEGDDDWGPTPLPVAHAREASAD